MEALSEKTVLLVTHQVDFLPGFHSCLVSRVFTFLICNAAKGVQWAG